MTYKRFLEEYRQSIRFKQQNIYYEIQAKYRPGEPFDLLGDRYFTFPKEVSDECFMFFLLLKFVVPSIKLSPILRGKDAAVGNYIHKYARKPK